MDDLTKKQAEFVAEYVENGHNGTQAALQVYDTTDENTAAVIASENLRKPKIESAIKSIAERVNVDKVMQRLDEGLDAVKLVTTPTGSDVEIDFATRHKYIDASLKVVGGYAPTKQDHTTGGEKMNFTVINYDKPTE